LAWSLRKKKGTP